MPSFGDGTQKLELTAEMAPGADLSTAPHTWPWVTLNCTHPTDNSQTISRLLNTPITIKRGVLVGAGGGNTSSGTLHLLNHDGALTPQLITSPYSPYVDAGTPIRLRLRTTSDIGYSDTFTRTVGAGGWGTATSGNTYVYGAGTSAQFSVSSGSGRVAIDAVNAIRRTVSSYIARDVDITFDTSTPVAALSQPIIMGAAVRYQSSSNYLWLSVEYRTGTIVGYKVWAVVGGVFNSILSITTGLTYTPGQVFRCRVQVVGEIVRAKVWAAANPEPSAWLSEIRETTHVLAAGNVAWVSLLYAGNTNTLPVTAAYDNISVQQPPYDVLEGYIADVRPTFSPQPDGTTWSTVMVDVGGVGSRLEKLNAPSFSPMRRSIQLAATVPDAYWPLEDGQGATFGAPAYPGQPKMVPSGPAVFGFDSGIPEDTYQTRYGTKPLVSVAAGASLTATVPLSGVGPEWAVDFTNQMFVPGIGGGVTEVRIFDWLTPGGTQARWSLVGTLTGYVVRAWDAVSGASTDVVTVALGPYSQLIVYEIDAVQNGANIDVNLFLNSGPGGSGSIAGTLAMPQQITGNPAKVNTTASTSPAGIRFNIGHVRVTDDTSGSGLPYYFDTGLGSLLLRADTAWYQEALHRRIQRQCEEERIPFSLVGNPYVTGVTQAGAQQDGSFTQLITAAAEAESGGILFESGFGYRYLARSQRYNRPVALTINMATYRRSDGTAQEDVLVPQLGSKAANYWTVERKGGSEGTYAAPASYRARRGTIAEKITLDVLRDEDTEQHAAWRVNQSYSAKEAIYPGIPIDLAANPSLIEAWLACEIGSRIVRTNQPSIAGLGDIDQTADGITETISPTSWIADVSASPAKVWDVAVADDPVMGKADTTSSTFRAASISATTLLIDVLEGPRWTTDPAQFPIYVSLATGEDIRIDAISGTSNPQTATVVRFVGGRSAAIPADTAFSLTRPARAAL